MQLIRKFASTSNIIRARVRNSTSGQGFTGLTSASSGLIVSTICDNEAAPTVYTAAGSTIESITTLGTFATPTATKCRLKLVDDTNEPGLIEIQLANARFAVANAKTLRIYIHGVSGMVGTEVLVQLDPVPVEAVSVRDAVGLASANLDTQFSSASSDLGGVAGYLLPTLGQARAGSTSTTIVLAMAEQAVDDTYKGQSVYITAGTGTAQARRITAYNGTTKVATVEPAWATTPSTDSMYVVGMVNVLTSGDVPTANQNADALLDRSNGVESGFTLRQVLRLIASVLLGKSSNGGKTFRDLGDTKARVTATVDSSHNRTAITRDAS